jgi:hypothetical protein
VRPDQHHVDHSADAYQAANAGRAAADENPSHIPQGKVRVALGYPD